MSNQVELLSSLNIVRDFPAYSTIKLNKAIANFYSASAPDSFYELFDNDTLYCETPNKKHGSLFKAGSVISYSLRNGIDPIESLNKAIKNGHSLHYIVGLGVMVTDSYGDKTRYIHVEIDDIVLFEGIYFVITAAANDNIKLVKYER